MEKEMIKIWLDDWREAPRGYVWVKSVDDAKAMIENCERQGLPIVLVDCDYDLGMYEVHSSHPAGSMRMENFIASFWP